MAVQEEGGWGMSREAMKLALEAMERYQVKRQDFDRFADEITALQKALANEALDKKAENARELGLDYEPAQQEPVAKHYVDGGHLIYPKAQRPWVGLTDEERKRVRNTVGYNQLVTAGEYAEHVQKATEAKLTEKNT